MVILIWIGAALTVVGLLGLMRSAVIVLEAGKDDEAMRLAMRRAMKLNFKSLAIAGLGLMAVVIGLILQ